MDFKSDRAAEAYSQLLVSAGREGDELERKAQSKRQELGEHSYMVLMIEISKFRQDAMAKAIVTAAEIEVQSVALTAHVAGHC